MFAMPTSTALLPELRIRTFQDAILVPLQKNDNAPLPFSVGAFDRNGNPIDGLQLRRYHKATGSVRCEAARRQIRGSAFYGGIGFRQFGHFLLESLARLWAIERYSPTTILWHAFPNHNAHVDRTSWQREILDICKLTSNRHELITEPVIVENLIVADPGFVIGHSFHPTLAAYLDRHDTGPIDPALRVWVSRSRFGTDAMRIGKEDLLENALQDLGWEVFHPEEHPVRTQLSTLGRAARIAGIMGSALHSLILLKDYKGLVTIVPRNEHQKINRNYELIAMGKGFLQNSTIPLLRAPGDAKSPNKLEISSPQNAAHIIHSFSDIS